MQSFFFPFLLHLLLLLLFLLLSPTSMSMRECKVEGVVVVYGQDIVGEGMQEKKGCHGGRY